MRGRIRPQRRVVLDGPHRGKDVDRGIRASCGCSTGDGTVHQEQAGVLVSPLCGGGELDCHTKVMSGDLNFSKSIRASQADGERNAPGELCHKRRSAQWYRSDSVACDCISRACVSARRYVWHNGAELQVRVDRALLPDIFDDLAVLEF